MQNSNSEYRCRLGSSWFSSRWSLLILVLMTWPGVSWAWTGQPLAYVTSTNGISVIDTGDNKVVDTIPGFAAPIAVAPDGKHLYAFGAATSDFVFNISVIDPATHQVVANIPLDVSQVPTGVSLTPFTAAIAVTPDGKHVYATTGLCSDNSPDCVRPESTYFAVWEIDTATNKVLAASPGKGKTDGIAFTPDSQHTYLANFDPYNSVCLVLEVDTGSVISLPGFGSIYSIAITPDGTRAYVPENLFLNEISSTSVLVIDILSNTLVKTITTGPPPPPAAPVGTAVAVTPDGKYAYVTNEGSNNLTVIDTASNTLLESLPVGTTPTGVAVTPDGKDAYVTNQGSNDVSVIETASNTVVATISVPGPGAIAIVPSPQGTQFLSFKARLDIDSGRNPRHDAFDLRSTFMVSNASGGAIHPDTEPVRLQVGSFITTIPAGTFRHRERSYTYEGVIDGVRLEARFELMGGFAYAFRAEAEGVDLKGTTNPLQVSLGIGKDAGQASVKARFDRVHRDRFHDGEW
jgi:YVTN family beta-propeller protein